MKVTASQASDNEPNRSEEALTSTDDDPQAVGPTADEARGPRPIESLSSAGEGRRWSGGNLRTTLLLLRTAALVITAIAGLITAVTMFLTFVVNWLTG
ncbi:hypothetical protein KZZ52_49915 [Dactylosporangium sp. AC04546]|uniref:hypothetical protein n=1 Tax=Dactylosporangium sp. AC04546 TaxID=2862460 RepID=UPI001EE02A88|nr:hypothetical protein [Dactylosporangium sp. AC04546]WVK82002.1 hypothetical protein KZZ52_49915 [Dactylosporangium sp. AC04546]